ncbi:MAG: hypothetical protein AB1728_11705 [Bacteroidota bacterium]
MGKNLIKIFLISLAILFSSCEESTSPNGSKNDSLLPLQIGNYWTYYQFTLTPPTSVDSFKLIIENLFTNNAQNDFSNAYIMSIYDLRFGNKLDYRWLYKNEPDGLYLLGGISASDTLLRKIKLLKYPVDSNEVWLVPNITYQIDEGVFKIKDTTLYKCVSTKGRFTLNGQEYFCYVYHHRTRQGDDILAYWEIFDFYVPNTGKIGSIIMVDTVVTHRIELRDFKLLFPY